MQLTATRYGVGVGAVGRLHAERHVPLQLPVQPVPQLAASDELPLTPRKRAVVDDEVDRNRWLLHRDALQALRVVHGSDGLTDFDAFEPREYHDVTRRRVRNLYSIETVEG